MELLGLGFWVQEPLELLDLGFCLQEPLELMNLGFLGTGTIGTVLNPGIWVQGPSELLCFTLDIAGLGHRFSLATAPCGPSNYTSYEDIYCAITYCYIQTTPSCTSY